MPSRKSNIKIVDAEPEAEMKARLRAEIEAEMKAGLQAVVDAEKEAKIKADKEAKRLAEERAKLPDNEKRIFDLVHEVKDMNNRLEEVVETMPSINNEEDYDTYISELGDVIQALTTMRNLVIGIKSRSDEIDQLIKFSKTNIENNSSGVVTV